MPTSIVVAVDVDLHLALADDRLLVLGDLIALRQVGIEVVLAVEHRDQVDLGLQAKAGAHGLGDAGLVDHRQHARHGRIDQRDVAVGLAAERRGGAGEQLGLGGDLGVHLQADHDLPVAGGALDEVGGAWLFCHACIALGPCPAHSPAGCAACNALARAADAALVKPAERWTVSIDFEPISRLDRAPATAGERSARDRDEAQNPSRDGRACAWPRRHSGRGQDLPLRLPGRPQRARPLHAERELHARRPRQRDGGADQARQGPEDHPGPGRALGDRRSAEVALPSAQGRQVPQRRGLHRRRRGVLRRAHAQPRLADQDARAGGHEGRQGRRPHGRLRADLAQSHPALRSGTPGTSSPRSGRRRTARRRRSRLPPPRSIRSRSRPTAPARSHRQP